MRSTILVADARLWELRHVLQEVWGGEARLLGAWPVALAHELIRREQPAWILLPAGEVACLQTCRALRTLAPGAWLVGVSDAGTTEFARTALDAILPRPLSAGGLQEQLAALLESRRNGGRRPGSRDLIGAHPKIVIARQWIAKAASSDAPVLLRGESGSGKEVAAAMIHQFSPRAAAPFIKVNCAAIPRELLESELFGYEPGAFTGAARKKAGKFELAHRGTILLDEISELDPTMQAKLLHILQSGEFSRLGGETSEMLEARVLAASNADLEGEVAAGRFRPDLFYRLNVLSVRLPPLRERIDDLEELVEHFLRLHAPPDGAAPVRLSAAAMVRLRQHDWPGNVRELENFVRRMLILGSEAAALEELAPLGGEPPLRTPPRAALPSPALSSSAGAPSLVEIGRRAAREAERAAILAALEETRWNRRQAARLLKISYKALHNKLRRMKQEAAPPPANVHPWPADANARAAG
ncbi:MAG TPA: sigma-54 dependent transcriptional regulator [Terriglobales bacterium]|nr:sigma-54 dependent transcriptional regulator [Terriglobales bacterium]